MLLRDNAGEGAVMLRPIRFQCGSLDFISFPCTYIYMSNEYANGQLYIYIARFACTYIQMRYTVYEMMPLMMDR